MLEEFQRGHWNQCKKLIANLEKKYPGNSKLLEFKKEFELHYSIVNTIETTAKSDKNTKILQVVKNAVIIAVVFIGILLLIWYGIRTISENNRKSQLQTIANKMDALSVQVDSLLSSGQPDRAAELIKSMRAIDPTNPKIDAISQKVDKALKVNSLYSDAVNKLNAGSYSDAVNILKEIQNEYPGYKDVPQLIENATTKVKISQMLNDGTTAYNSGNWPDAISNFEQILKIGSSDSYPNLKEMLTNSYIQSALLLINDPAQTIDTLNQAATFMGKAASLNPQDASIHSAVDKLNLYRYGFSYYVGMNWPSAINQLQGLVALDGNYASGFAKQILYESFISLGNLDFAAGSYDDARKIYESAKALVSGGDNLMSTYLVEIYLGRTLGMLKQFDLATSQFNMAIQTIGYDKRGIGFPTLRSNLHQAVQLYQNGQYEDAYKLFSDTLVGNNSFYQLKMINAYTENCLALIANQYQSSVQAILEQNKLPQQTIITSQLTLIIPSMP